MALPPALRLTLTPSQRAATDLTEESFDEHELRELFESQEGEKDGYAFVPSLFRPCPPRCWRAGTPSDCGGGRAHRLAENVTAMTGFVADIDDVTEQRIGDLIDGIRTRAGAKGVECVAYETFSHRREAAERGEAKGRYRLVIPFREPVAIANPMQWSKAAWPMLVRHFGLNDVPGVVACKDPGRLYYLPRRPAGELRDVAFIAGERFDARTVIDDLSRFVVPTPIPPPVITHEDEDPSRPVDLDALRERLVQTSNPNIRRLAQRCVRGEALSPPPEGRSADEPARHMAWWHLLGRLSIIAEPWMSSAALLEIVRSSHDRERAESPNDHKPWDEGPSSVVALLAQQRATAPAHKVKQKLAWEARNAVARNAIDALSRARQSAPRLATASVPATDDDERAPAAEAQAPASNAAAWSVDAVRDVLEVKHNAMGNPTYLGSLQNLVILFTRAPEWCGAFKQNELTKNYELWPCPGMRGSEPQRFSEAFITKLRLLLAANANYPVKAPRDEVRFAAEYVASENPYDPLKDYLSALKWDGVQRLDTWLVEYMQAKATSEDGTDLHEYLGAIGKRWLISGVARALQPGCQADSILQIDGDQGVGKTSALRILGGEFYLESTSDFESKDTANMLSSAWIVELGELTSFGRASENVQKNFLSRRVDEVVQKYEKYRTSLPRRCVLAGTTNQTEYLTDTTGNRRHWTFTVERQIDLAKLDRDRGQLWAEAVALYRSGERWHLTAGEVQIARQEAEKHAQTDILDEAIEKHFLKKPVEKRPRGILPVDIAHDVLEDRQGKTPKRRITASLKRLGFVHKTLWLEGRAFKRWALPSAWLGGWVEREDVQPDANANATGASDNNVTPLTPTPAPCR